MIITKDEAHAIQKNALSTIIAEAKAKLLKDCEEVYCKAIREAANQGKSFHRFDKPNTILKIELAETMIEDYFKNLGFGVYFNTKHQFDIIWQ